MEQRGAAPTGGRRGGRGRVIVLAHPSPDLYGSDLQFLETVTGLVEDGWSAHVMLPTPGPLVDLLQERGAHVDFVRFPALRKSLLSPRRLPGFLLDSFHAHRAAVRVISSTQPAAVWVNTLTIPTWLTAAGLTATPALLHVHEAEESGPRLVRMGLVAPVALARMTVINSSAAGRAITDLFPRLGARLRLVYNGVPGPDDGPAPLHERAPSDPVNVVLVGRLSPRKGTDVALEAVGLLTTRGVNVHLHLYGEVFPGYEWFEASLLERAARRDLAGRVTFHGYVRPVWDPLAEADIVIVPSRTEPFGNVAVEAQLARRPVIVSDVQGLAEIVRDEANGLLATAGDAQALADAIGRLAASPALAGALAEAGRLSATDRFSPERYRREVTNALADVVDGQRPVRRLPRFLRRYRQR